MHFVELRDYVKQKLHDPLVITNPGFPATCVSRTGRLERDLRFCQLPGIRTIRAPATLQAYDPSRFAAMPYNISNVETMQRMVKDAIIKRIGYLYVSDAKPPNLWGKLPAYWEAEVDAVSRLR